MNKRITYLLRALLLIAVIGLCTQVALKHYLSIRPKLRTDKIVSAVIKYTDANNATPDSLEQVSTEIAALADKEGLKYQNFESLLFFYKNDPEIPDTGNPPVTQDDEGNFLINRRAYISWFVNVEDLISRK